MSWPTVKLGDVCEIVSGATPSTSVKENWGSDYFWATPKDLSSLNAQTISKTDRKISAQGLRSCSANLLPVNSVLFSSRAPIGLVAINTVPIATNQGFKSLIPNINCLDAKYLYFWLKKNKKNIDTMGVGATFKEVSKAIVARIEIPLPPLAQQKRIAAILDKADEIKRKREQAIAKLDQLAQSIFVEMFGDVEKNQKNLPIKKLGDVAKFINGGTPKKDVKGYWNGDIAWISSADIVDDKVQLERNYISTLAIKDSATNLVPANTLLIVTRTGVGKITITPIPLCFSQDITAILLSENCDIQYIAQSIKSQNQAIVAQARGATIKGITRDVLVNLKVPFPPIALQEQFATRISKLEKLKASNKAALEKHNQLFASLQNQAFTGQL